MRAFLLIVGLILVVALTALFAAPVFIDWNAYRGTFEKQATALLGREVRVGGNASLRLLPSPYMHFDNIRIADQTGRFDNPLLRVEGFTIWLSVPPLLRGAIEAREVELDGPDIRLSVDDQGRANWQGLAAGEVSLPFMPTEVSLASVKIKNGRLAITRSGRPPVLAVEGVEGELAATRLKGPYRFKGQLDQGGVKREVRISTAALAPEGSLKVKAVVRAIDGANTFSFDGDLLSLDALPRLAGALEADLDMGTGALSADFSAAASPADAPPPGPRRMRVTGRLEADLDRGAITELNATVDSQGRPQLVTGEIAFDWTKALAIQSHLSARWLDLDHIAGAPVGQGPWPALESYTGRFLSAFASEAETRIIASIDQATLGGDLIDAIAVDARRTPAGIEIASLTARLPGATSLEVTGLLAEEAGAHKFNGPVRLSGTSLGKLLKWSVPSLAVTGPGTSGFYMLGADASLSADTVALDNLSLEIARSRIGGAVRYAAGKPAQLTVALDGDRLDLSDIVTEAPTLDGLAGASFGETPVSKSSTQDRSLAAIALGLLLDTEAQVGLHIGELNTGAGRLENVALTMSRGGGRVDLDALTFRTGSQLSVQAKGTMASEDGFIRLRIEAPTPESITALDHFLALPEAVRGPALRYAVKAPLRLAGSIRRETERGGGRSEIALDGSADGARVTLRVRSDKPFSEIASGQTDITATLADKDGRRLLGRLAGVVPVASTGDAGAGEVAPAGAEGEAPATLGGEVTLRASGVPQEKLTTVLRIAAAGSTASFEGEARVHDGEPAATGRIDFSAPSAKELLQALGIPAGGDFASAMTADASVQATAAGLVIDRLAAIVDGAKVTGMGKLAYDEAEPLLDLSLQTDRASLPALLTPLLASPSSALAPDAVAEAEAAVANTNTEEEGEAPNVWPDRAFDFSQLKGWRSRIKLKAGTLILAGGLPVDDAELVATSSGEGLVLEKLSGNAVGGAVAVRGTLERQVAGARLSVEASLTGAELEELFVDPAGRSTATGSADAKLTFKASSLTPRGMVAVLEGDGVLSVEDGRIIGLSPVTIDQAARQLLLDGAKVTDETIAEAIGASRGQADFPLGTIETKLTVVDGTIRVAPVTVAAEPSTLTLEGRIEIDTLRLASDWTLSPRQQTPQKVPLPPVTILFEGPLTELRTLEPQADVEALQRDLLARQLIGEPDQLNGLWPDAPPRVLPMSVPDADRAAAIPAETGIVPVAGDAGAGTAKAASTGSTARSSAEAAPPAPAPAKSKRKTRRKTVTIREDTNFGLR